MVTPLRNVRIDDALWSALKGRAREEGTDASAKIRELVTDYLEKGGQPDDQDR